MRIPAGFLSARRSQTPPPVPQEQNQPAASQVEVVRIIKKNGKVAA